MNAAGGACCVEPLSRFVFSFSASSVALGAFEGCSRVEVCRVPGELAAVDGECPGRLRVSSACRGRVRVPA